MSNMHTDDGITHINIYSKGRTELGRWLSNFTYAPITLEDGKFNSIEGYWYWLNTGDPRLRDLHGFEAKSLGKTLTIKEPADFEEKIKHAMAVKLDTYKSWKEEFKESSLPFTHYYVFNDKVVPAGYEWIVREWERLRRTK